MATTPSKKYTDRELSGYFRTVGRHRVIGREKERDLAKRAAEGSCDDRNRLVLANVAFVLKVAREYRGLGLPFEDLVSEGTVGLIEAADRFDPDNGAKFLTFATWWVRKRILEALTDRTHLVRVPASRLSKLRKILDADRRLTAELGRRPDSRELRVATGEAQTTIDSAFLLARSHAASKPVNEDGEALDPVDLLAEPDSVQALDRLLDDESRSLLCEAISELEPREVLVIARRFGLGGRGPLTLRELGEALDLSRERVRQIEFHAMRQLRRSLRRKRRKG